MAEELENKPVENTEYTQEDIQQNKTMAILAYIGPLCFVPTFAAKESKFARYHANQGLALFIIEAALYVLRTFFVVILPLGVAWAISLIIGLALIFPLVLSIIGIVNAAQGKTKDLPIVSKIKILK